MNEEQNINVEQQNINVDHDFVKKSSQEHIVEEENMKLRIKMLKINKKRNFQC